MLLLGACAPSRSGDARAPGGALLRAPEPGAPAVSWRRKSRDERMEYMGLYVFPKMKALFKTFDATAYGKFRCQTCHGEDMEAVDYKMPNGIYALPADNPEQAARDYDEKTTQFMVASVLPALRELLAKNDPELSKAMSCNTCHPKE